MVRSSGPEAKELPLLLIACETISGEKRDTELSRLSSARQSGRTGRWYGRLRRRMFNKSCCYFYVAAEQFGGKGDRLIGRAFWHVSH